VAPDARVVYVDIDPMVSSHASALMAGSGVVTLQADLREPGQVLSDPRVRDLLDFGQPVGIMFMCVLHCLWDKEEPWAVVRQFCDALPSGKLPGPEPHMPNEVHPQGAQALFQMTQDLHWNTPLISRSRGDIMRFFDGFALVEPGLVSPAQWRPDLHNPLRGIQEDDSGTGPVLKPVVPERTEEDRWVQWHLCGIGIKP